MSLKRLHVPVCVLALAVSKAQGAGLELNQHGVKELSHGFAGTAALVEDASAIAHNPAGLTRLEGDQFSGGVSAIYADLEYEGTLYAEKIENTYGVDRSLRDPDAPGNASSKAVTAVPHLYFSHQVNDQTAVGIGLYAPFGSGSDFPDGWQGRYHAEETEQTTVNLNPTIATELSDTVSIGLGAVVQMYEATLTNQIDLGYLVAEATLEQQAESSGDISQDDIDAVYDVFLPANEPDRNDLYNDIAIDSIAYGFSFGVLWEPSEQTRIGFNFRSRTDHMAEGEAKRPLTEEYKQSLLNDAEQFVGPDRVENVGAAFDKRGAQGGDLYSRVSFPEVATLSFHHEFLDRWAVMGSASYINWSIFDEIRLEYAIDENGQTADNADTSAPVRGGEDIGGMGEDLRRRDLVQPLNFEDSMRYGLGLSYQWSPQLTLRTGASYDESPLEDPDFRTPRGPDNDRIILGLGASYTVGERLSVDMGYALSRIKESDVSPRENPAHTLHRLEGSTQGDLHSFGLQANYNF
ncbi:MAG: OmpP1/FadL family transporter [Pseudomonadota bacterium]